MLTKDHLALARVLAENKEISGSVLASSFHVSRTTISNWVAVLSEAGLDIESRPGMGYHLTSPVDFYNEHALVAHVQAIRPDTIVRVYESVTSTNDEAMRLSRTKGSCVICVAEAQTGGRGRRGRTWFSPPALNISLSIAWRYETGIASLEGLSLAVGVAVADALNDLGVIGVKLKWPNDLYLNEAKLGGILIEVEGDFQGPCTVVVGVGVNRWLSSRVKATINQAVTDIWSVRENFTPSRHDLTITLSQAICDVLIEFPLQGLSGWRDQWMQRDVLLGKDVRVEGYNAIILGKAIGIDAKGALLVLTDQGVQAMHGGEVSVREK